MHKRQEAWDEIPFNLFFMDQSGLHFILFPADLGYRSVQVMLQLKATAWSSASKLRNGKSTFFSDLEQFVLLHYTNCGSTLRHLVFKKLVPSGQGRLKAELLHLNEECNETDTENFLQVVGRCNKWVTHFGKRTSTCNKTRKKKKKKKSNTSISGTIVFWVPSKKRIATASEPSCNYWRREKSWKLDILGVGTVTLHCQENVQSPSGHSLFFSTSPLGKKWKPNQCKTWDMFRKLLLSKLVFVLFPTWNEMPILTQRLFSCYLWKQWM